MYTTATDAYAMKTSSGAYLAMSTLNDARHTVSHGHPFWDGIPAGCEDKARELMTTMGIPAHDQELVIAANGKVSL